MGGGSLGLCERCSTPDRRYSRFAKSRSASLAKKLARIGSASSLKS
jgi:hypothetical protein